jgi:hypothetical protein
MTADIITFAPRQQAKAPARCFISAGGRGNKYALAFASRPALRQR